MKDKNNEVLSDYQLEYEEMELSHVSKTTSKATKVTKATKKKPAVKTASKPKVTLKSRIDSLGKIVAARFSDVKKKLGLKSKKPKKTTKLEQKSIRKQKINGIIGIGLLFVVVSIAYSTYMTNLFVDGSMMVIALAPQVVFATIILLIAFYKIYK